jgi:hypothetical protein
MIARGDTDPAPLAPFLPHKKNHAPSDPIGITSLYIGWGRDGATWVASEMKCIKDECVR